MVTKECLFSSSKECHKRSAAILFFSPPTPGQARMDGVACTHGEEEKMEYLKRLSEKGICNIEMECTALSSICHATNIKCAVVCVALLNRFNGDQVCVHACVCVCMCVMCVNMYVLKRC